MEAVTGATANWPHEAVVVSSCPTRVRVPRSPTLTVADLLRRYVPSYLARHGEEVSPHQRHVLLRLRQCQTADLGGHGWHCQACGHRHYAYNSCNNRHCSTCCRAPQLRWLEKVRSWRLPVRFYHVVFTVPHELCDLILANRGPLYGLLFQESAHTLLALGRQQLQAELGTIATLHAWGQYFLPHPHTHHIVLPGGPALDGSHWVDAAAPEDFLQAADIAQEFRARYLRGIVRLYRRGEVTLPASMCAIDNSEQLEAWLAPLTQKTWMVDCQGPPANCDNAEAVLDYLAKYVAGTAIHNHRILRDDGHHVTFTAKNYRTGTREEVTITGEEFVRRFFCFTVPKGFHRWRCYGQFASKKRDEKLARCRRLLGCDAKSEQTNPEHPAAHVMDEVYGIDKSETKKRCPRCLLWAMIWLGRLTAEAMATRQAQQVELCELLLTVVTTSEVDTADLDLRPATLLGPDELPWPDW